MNKRKKLILKIGAAVLAIILIVLIFVIANSFVGNPVSKNISKNNFEIYTEEKFPGLGYIVEAPQYDFKFGEYYAMACIPGSPDNYFYIFADSWGKIKRDTSDNIISGWNTSMRLSEDYRRLADSVLNSSGFEMKSDLSFGELMFDIDESAVGTPSEKYYCSRSDLKIDGSYDINEFGREHGRIVFYYDSEDISLEKAASVLLAIRNAFDRAGVSFRVIDFTLQKPAKEDFSRDDGVILAYNYPYELITEEGLSENLSKYNEERAAYYKELDEARTEYEKNFQNGEAVSEETVMEGK